MSTRTHSVRAADIVRAWWLVDLEGKTLGRAATKIAGMLLGKGKPAYAPHLEVGDNVIVVNAGKVHVTGNKLADKIYYRHSGYPGGLKETNLETLLAKFPDRPITKAVKGMLPKTKLGRHALGRMHVYAGPDHPHEAQEPKVMKLDGDSSG
jgi:large subunit ribosomal protein L13